MNSTFTNEPLKHGLDFSATVSLVVGTVIGTGVFLKPAVMTQEVNSVLWVFLAWIAAGFLSLAGALCYAELGSRFPQAGGEYVYLREAFGELPAFLNGWMRFCIGNPGSIAAYAVGLVTFLNGATHFSTLTQTVVAVLIIAVFTLINCATVHAAGLLQTYMAAFKILLILILTFAIFIFADTEAMSRFHTWREDGLAGKHLAPPCSRRFGLTTAGMACPWPAEKFETRNEIFLLLSSVEC
jgi:APA family basic amino acid/polyamine antiporter